MERQTMCHLPVWFFFSYEYIDPLMVELGLGNTSTRGAFRNNLQVFAERLVTRMGLSYGTAMLQQIPWANLEYVPPDMFVLRMAPEKVVRVRMKGRKSSATLCTIINYCQLRKCCDEAVCARVL